MAARSGKNKLERLNDSKNSSSSLIADSTMLYYAASCFSLFQFRSIIEIKCEGISFLSGICHKHPSIIQSVCGVRQSETHPVDEDDSPRAGAGSEELLPAVEQRHDVLDGLVHSALLTQVHFVQALLFPLSEAFLHSSLRLAATLTWFVCRMSGRS